MTLQTAFLKQALSELGHAQKTLADQAELSLSAWLDEQLARCHDTAFRERFAQGCPIPGIPASAYSHQLLPGLPRLLAGIRFKGGDTTQPFVDLLAWDRPVLSADLWKSIIARIHVYFAPFAPRWIRIRWPGETPPPLSDHALEVDQIMVAGQLAKLVHESGTELSVKRATDREWYPQFLKSFHAWAALAGPLADEVSPASESDFDRCLELGAVVCAWHQGRWAGVAAAAREDERALSGYAVVEEFLDGRVRGRGLGVALQSALISILAQAAPDDVLWGTIHGTNMASRKTALRCGRTVVESWWFIALSSGYTTATGS